MGITKTISVEIVNQFLDYEDGTEWDAQVEILDRVVNNLMNPNPDGVDNYKVETYMNGILVNQ